MLCSRVLTESVSSRLVWYGSRLLKKSFSSGLVWYGSRLLKKSVSSGLVWYGSLLLTERRPNTCRPDMSADTNTDILLIS